MAIRYCSFTLAVSAYPAVLTTRVRLLEQRSQTVAYVERLLSVYISDLHLNAVALVESATSCPGWELACRLCMTPSLEALLGGDYSMLEDDICEAGEEDTEYNPFAEGEEDMEGEEDDGASSFALTGSFH